MYVQLTYDKGAKSIQLRKDSLFTKGCWENGTATCKRTKVGLALNPHTNINSKWMKDLNLRLETVKFLEENAGSKPVDMGFGNSFLDLTPKGKATKAKINKRDCIHPKNLHS